MSRPNIGIIHVASVREFDGEAVLIIKGTEGTLSVGIPEDKIEPFKETVNELEHVYMDDPPKNDYSHSLVEWSEDE